MQKRTMRSLPLAALLTASVNAQSSTVTSTIPVCPTASSITITLPTTVTFCPGPHCNGGGPQITPPPANGVGMPGVNVGQYTSVGPDGKTTVFGIWETVYDSLCETGLVPATWTITQECPCEATPHPTMLPAGFETTVVPCSVCAHPTITLTQPCPTGPYATQTPSVGQSPAAPAPAVPAPAGLGAGASAGSGSGASAAAYGSGASAGAGSGAGASAQSGPGGASASAGSSAGSSAGATSQSSPGGASAEAGAGSGADAQAAPGGASANADSGAGANGEARPAPASMNGTMSTPMNNSTHPGTAPIQSYVSSAGQATVAGFTLFVGVVGSLLL